ncbi:MAG: RNA polymerase sigma factor [Bryobacteraceae bacterium]|nr:RNA polymerase sigma factor [Solibacteraceae bacterium]MCO5353940.1 RNA polymerase sigma factor [Bryobacteraceae bacterium]
MLELPMTNAFELAMARPERLSMTESEFREFYAFTAGPVKSFLVRTTGNAATADDLLQESYYRFLRAELPEMDRAGQKNYLFRIATNLVRDHFRRNRHTDVPLEDHGAASHSSGIDAAADVRKALAGIEPRERELVWLAYVEGASHREIASITGLKEASIRPLLYRVRQKLAAFLRREKHA